MAAEQLQAGGLFMGTSQQESELLLQQTAEAADLGLTVKGTTGAATTVLVIGWGLQGRVPALRQS